MSFANLSDLWLVFLVPLAAALGWYRRRERERRLAAFADSSLLPQLGLDQRELRRRARRYATFLIATSIFFVLGVLRPQWGFEWKDTKRRGSDIVFAIDVSDSMLAADASPSRLERARREVLDLLGMLKGDRVGLVSFAGVSFVETPLTLDYGAFRMFLENLSPANVPVKGSNMEDALRKSLEALGIKDGEEPKKKESAAIILLTDGEELDGDVSRQAALAKASGVRVFIMGVGSEEGAPIPSSAGYKRDKEGKIVISRLRPNALEELAKETGGTYVRSVASSQDSAAIYLKGVRRSVGTSDFEAKSMRRWREYFQLPVLCALILLLLGPWSGFRMGRTAGVAALFALLVLPRAAGAESAEELGAEARRAYEKGEYTVAKEKFEQGQSQSPEDPRFLEGIGSSAYRLNDFETAQTAFAAGAALASEESAKARALFNLGNSFVQGKRYQDAIRSYEQSLKLRPDDAEARENLAYAKLLLEEQKKQQQKERDQSEQEKNEQKSSDAQEKGSDGKEQESENKDGAKQGESSSPGEKDPKGEPAERQENTQPQDGSGESNKESPGENGDEQKPDEPTGDPEKEDSAKGDQDSNNNEQGANGEEQNKQEDKGSSAENEPPSGAEPKDSSSENTGANKGTGKDDANRQLDALVEGVQEQQGVHAQYRMKKAMEQLKLEKRRPPEKDW